METLYDLLGALPNDDADDLRAAFRRAVKRAHPDVNPEDPDAGLKFRRIVRANEILGDAEQRGAYDHLLEVARLEQEQVAKGSGLSLMIEILSSLLIANPIISTSLNGSAETPFNGLVMAIDPSAFGNRASFTQAVDQLCHAIKGLPPASDTGQVFLPGERGFAESDKRRREGIPLAAGTLSRLVALATKQAVPVPSSLR